MNRDDLLQRLDDRNTRWDMIIVGGGATGLGVASSPRRWRSVITKSLTIRRASRT